MKKFLTAVVVCLAIWGLVYEYREHKLDRLLSSGDTVSPDDSAPSSGSPSNSTLMPLPAEQPPPATPVIVPGSVTPPASPPVQTAAAPEPRTPLPQPAPALKLPVQDTIAPNPPNGAVFAGTGRFQVYRQGNLTWRLNTDNGQTCVLFATDAEWRKPRVYQNGCPRS